MDWLTWRDMKPTHGSHPPAELLPAQSVQTSPELWSIHKSTRLLLVFKFAMVKSFGGARAKSQETPAKDNDVNKSEGFFASFVLHFVFG